MREKRNLSSGFSINVGLSDSDKLLLHDVNLCLSSDALDPKVLIQDASMTKRGNTWGGGYSGQFLYCLMRHKTIVNAVTYFAGYPGFGTAFLMGLANKWKHQNRLPYAPLIAPEAHYQYYSGLVELYNRMNVSIYIDLRYQLVTPKDTKDMCPHKSTDLFDADLSCSMPNHLWESFFSSCRPKYWAMTNSGMKCDCGGEKCDHWHPVENFVHDYGFLPFYPHLKYSLLVDRVKAGVYKTPDRKFSLYVLKGELSSVPSHLEALAKKLSVDWNPCGKSIRPKFCG